MYWQPRHLIRVWPSHVTYFKITGPYWTHGSMRRRPGTLHLLTWLRFFGKDLLTGDCDGAIFIG